MSLEWDGPPVTVYGVDSGRRVLVAMWPAVVGRQAAVVAELGSADEESAARICHVLTDVSAALWGVYARPASAAVDERERGMWEEERAALDEVVSAVRRPHLPTAAGLLVVPYNRVLEAAHRLGRQVHGVGDAGLTEAVAAADEVLRQDPFGVSLMGTPLDPAARCLAAAHWLAAAAVVAARAAGTGAEAVFAEADEVQAVPVEVPALVVRRVLTDGVAPREVVRE